MGVRLEFVGRYVNLILGELFKMTEQMNAQGPIVGWQEVLITMRNNGIAGIEVDGDDYQIISAEAALPPEAALPSR
jgi:site-specific DNA recombinase